MGAYYSVMLENFYESYYGATASSTDANANASSIDAKSDIVNQPFTTPEMFADLGNYPELIKKLK